MNAQDSTPALQAVPGIVIRDAETKKGIARIPGLPELPAGTPVQFYDSTGTLQTGTVVGTRLTFSVVEPVIAAVTIDVKVEAAATAEQAKPRLANPFNTPEMASYSPEQ